MKSVQCAGFSRLYCYQLLHTRLAVLCDAGRKSPPHAQLVVRARLFTFVDVVCEIRCVCVVCFFCDCVVRFTRT